MKALQSITKHYKACLTLPVLATMMTAPLSQAAVTSTFDANSDGWTVADMSDYYNTPLRIYSPSYNATGGNPDGYISTGDPTGNTFYWQALRLPQKNVTAHSYGSVDLAARSRIMISTMS